MERLLENLENIQSLLTCNYHLTGFSHIRFFKAHLKENHIQINVKFYSDIKKLRKFVFTIKDFQEYYQNNKGLNFDTYFNSFIESLN